MKRTLLIIACFALLTTAVLAQGTQRVKGSVRKDGTVIAPYERTKPNKTKDDNYSTVGNVNPNTGKKGTKKP